MRSTYFEDTVLLQDLFRACPRCLAPKPIIEAARKLSCQACGLEFFFNTAAAAGAFIFQDDNLILCIRSKDPGKGLLDVPGGFIEFGETIEDGLRREIREEIGIEVGPLRYFTSEPNRYLYGGTPYHTADLFFVARATSQVLVPEVGEIDAIHLAELGSIDPEMFAFPSTHLACLKLKDWILSHPI